MKKIAKYEIIEKLGKGGMGIVYKAFDPLMEREVAIKVLPEQFFDQAEIRERFYREARLAGKLSHENITIVHDLGEIDGRPYIVMEYLAGTDLKSIIKSKQELSLLQKLDYAKQVSSGLAYSHSKNLVHRDIKPENIRVLDDGKIKIMDFGIARPTTSTMTQTGATMGTPHYMSPEQIKAQKVDHRSDIFSFGILMYELFTYKLPFEGEDPTAVWYKIVHEQSAPIDEESIKHVSGIKGIILKCLQKEAQQRYKKMADVINDLDQIVRYVKAQEKKTGDEEEKKIDDLIARARKFLVKEDFKKASELADKAAHIAVENTRVDQLIADIEIVQAEKIDAFLWSASKFTDKKDFGNAAKMVKMALKLNPEHSAALKKRAKIEQARKALDSEAKTIMVARKQTPVKQKTALFRKISPKILAASGSIIAGVLLVVLYRMYIYSPSPPAGFVALNILPWAEVARVENSKGESVNISNFDGAIITPCRLSLAPGAYRLVLVNPAFKDSLALNLDIKPGAVYRINERFPEFDYSEALARFEN